MLQEFKKFILKGDLVEVAVGLIIALALKDVIDSLVADVITPIVAAVGGEPNFDKLSFGIGKGEIRYGLFLNAVVSFLIVGFILFLIVKAYNTAKDRLSRAPEEDEALPDDIVLLREIRDELRNRSTPMT